MSLSKSYVPLKDKFNLVIAMLVNKTFPAVNFTCITACYHCKNNYGSVCQFTRIAMTSFQVLFLRQNSPSVLNTRSTVRKNVQPSERLAPRSASCEPN